MIAFFLNCLYLNENIKKPYYVAVVERCVELTRNQEKIPVIAQEECLNALFEENKKKTVPYPIGQSIEENYIRHFTSEKEAWLALLSKEQREYIRVISKALEAIYADMKEYPSAVLTFSHCPSLVKVCKEKRIAICELEYSPIRFTNYSCTLGFLTRENKFSEAETAKRYVTFCKEIEEKKVDFLTRKELMALTFLEKNIHLLEEYNRQPEYEIGVALGPQDDCYREVWGGCEIEELLQKCREAYGDSVLIRAHPRDAESIRKFGIDIDESNNSLEFILRCKKIATISSNVGFEGMWFGRPTYFVGELPFSSQAMRDVSIDDDKVCDVKFINFLFFCCFAPFNTLHDAKYIEWRLTNPPELDIYRYNQKLLLDELGISEEIIKEPKDRLNRILEARGFEKFFYKKKSTLNVEKEKKQETREAIQAEGQYEKDKTAYEWFQEQLAKRDMELSNLEEKLAKAMIKGKEEKIK